MSFGDIRGLLQYVPQFNDKVFLITVNTPAELLLDAMLDFLSLQNIGVKLVISSNVHSEDILLDKAAEVELKFCNIVYQTTSEVVQMKESMDRGQAIILNIRDEECFSNKLIELSDALSAKKIILLHDKADGTEAGAIRAADVLLGGASLQSQAALACQSGIPRVHILNGLVPGVTLSELFSNEGVGTMVYADSYRLIRPIREDDIAELLAMIGRSVRNAQLVPRYYADIEGHKEDYFVMEIDGNVVGSVALYQYPDVKTAEVACLYVKENHEGRGYASELVSYAHEQARAAGLGQVFSLTNRIAKFFEEKLGYQEMPIKDIPEQRYSQLIETGRDSKSFLKTL